jgi:hypothetical protein
VKKCRRRGRQAAVLWWKYLGPRKGRDAGAKQVMLALLAACLKLGRNDFMMAPLNVGLT